MKPLDDKNANTLAVGEKVNAPACGAWRDGKRFDNE
jgi:hypothetical protein